VTSRNKEDVGCPYLYEKLSELKNLKLFVQGHIHEAYGRMDFPDGGIFVNASVLNLRYEMVNLPIQVEITV
jgi:Icc-related predicted phosphoesterase